MRQRLRSGDVVDISLVAAWRMVSLPLSRHQNHFDSPAVAAMNRVSFKSSSCSSSRNASSVMRPSSRRRKGGAAFNLEQRAREIQVSEVMLGVGPCLVPWLSPPTLARRCL